MLPENGVLSFPKKSKGYLVKEKLGFYVALKSSNASFTSKFEFGITAMPR